MNTQHNRQGEVIPWHGLGWHKQQKKNAYSTDMFWSLLWVHDHHQRIISYNVIKKMTYSATPDLNVLLQRMQIWVTCFIRSFVILHEDFVSAKCCKVGLDYHLFFILLLPMGVPTFDRLSLFEYYQAAMNCRYIHGNCKSPILGTAWGREFLPRNSSQFLL